jgi:glycosyltransferase involved in cell wall biosynthesis
MRSIPRISIVTVVLNGAQHLEETICSVIALESAFKIDYLIIDGGSTDSSVDIIRRYASQLAFWVSEPDAGIYDAMNKGWTKSAEDSYILFLGAGDRLISLPRIEDLNAGHDVVYGRVFVGPDTVFIPTSGYRLKLYNSLHHQALLVHKKRSPKAPFNLHYKTYADFDFNQRLLKSGAQFYYSPHFVAYAHPGGVSDHHCFSESLKVIWKNYGITWIVLAILGKIALGCFPAIRRMQPLKNV